MGIVDFRKRIWDGHSCEYCDLLHLASVKSWEEVVNHK